MLKNKIGYKTEKELIKLILQERCDKIKKLGFGLFKDDIANTTIEPFPKLLAQTHTEVQKKSSSLWLLKLKLENIVITTNINFINKHDLSKPTLVFQHGFLGTKQKVQLLLILNRKIYTDFNIISLGLHAHRNLADIRDGCVNTFLNLALTVGGSVQAMNFLVNYHKERSPYKIGITGFSLGGMSTSWHYYLYNTADLYFPIISYPNVGRVFLSQKLSKCIYNYEQISLNQSYLNCFEVPKNLKKRPKEKVFPILGTQDKIIDFETAKNYWKEFDTLDLNVGHYSLALGKSKIQKFILQKFSELQNA